jgi:putative nucleotidyltransferase with HDIG domain
MSSLHNKLRELFAQPNSMHSRPLSQRIVLSMVFFALCMVILSADFITDKISFQVGQVSDREVVAPRSVSYVDQIKTKKLEDEVLASVASVYDFDVTVAAKAEESAGAVFRAARTVAADKSLTSAEQKLAKLRAGLNVSLPETAVVGLATLNETELAKIEEHTRSILRKYLQRGIREDDLDAARKNIALEAEGLGLGTDGEAVVAGLAQTLVKPNFILNVRETDKRKQAALKSTEPVRETVKKGQVLVRRGDIVTAEQIYAMEELGLHRGSVNEVRIFGLAIFVLLVMGLIVGYLHKFASEVYDNDSHLVLLGGIILLTLLLGKAAHYYFSDFVAPIAAGALLTAILIDTRLGVFISIVLAVLFGVIVENDLRAVAVALVGSLTGVYSVSKFSHGYSLTRTGLWIAAINFITIGSSGFLEQINGQQIFVQGVYGAVGGLASAVITIGCLPYLESFFKITTPVKLMELANPSNPLLQRLLLDAPGTYHHSLLVGNLAETAASNIGADPVTVRVGAYYHDVGKIKRPYFFIENQTDAENPHDKIAPSLSTLIVTSHIKDGVDLCRDYKLPQPIIDIVQQHHGTMLVSYFYRRATENEHSECIIEADFRYEGPRPQSKEAALVMLADACEAAVRSLSRPNVNRVESTVRKVIRERLHDGQLDDCNLTLKDLNIIGDVFIRVLSSMFHSRIEYPDTLKELERKKGKNGNSAKQCPGREGAGADSEGDGDGRPN